MNWLALAGASLPFFTIGAPAPAWAQVRHHGTDGRNLDRVQATRSPSIDRSVVYFTEHADGIWVRGATYKARFAPTGFRYVPDFGSGAPRNFPVEFTLREARLGGESLDLTPSAHVVRDGNQFVLERGTVDVVYDVEVDQIAQSFVVDAAGATRDLSVVLDVTTDLNGASPGEAEGGGHRFEGELGAVLYGEAIVLDATGRREAITTELRDQTITLTVPAAFLARAEGIVVIDPVISTYAVDAGPGTQRDVEVSYDLTHDEFLYVYEDVFSATDTDIFATAVEANTGVLVAAEYYDSSDNDAENPSVANQNGSNISLCACQREASASFSHGIYGKIWNHGQERFGAEFLIAASGGFLVAQPDVGGSSSTQPGQYLCVTYLRNYLTDHDVMYQIVTPSGYVGFFHGALEFSADQDVNSVSISETAASPAGNVGGWQIAWAERRLSDQTHRLRTARVAGYGNLSVGPSTLKSVPPPNRIREVHVSNSIQLGSEPLPLYAVVYDVDAAGDEDTFVTIARGSSAVREVELQRSEHAGLRLDQSEARVAATGSRFVVAYIEGLAASGYRALLSSLELTVDDELAIAERRVDLGQVAPPGSSYHEGGALAMVSKFSGGDDLSQEIGIGIDRVTSAGSDVGAAVYDDSSPKSPAHQYCYGNPNSTGDRGFLRMEGDAQVQTPKTLRASSLPPGAFGYFIVGDGFANVANPAGSAGVLCVGGSIGRFVSQIQPVNAQGEMSITFHPSAIPQPSGPVASMPGERWQFSLWHRDSSPSGPATSNFTHAVSILFE